MQQLDTVEMMEKAMRLSGEGRFADAEATCRQVLEHESDNPDALYLLGVIELRRGQHNEALKCLTRAIQVEPDAHWYYTALSQVHSALGNPAESARALENVVRLEPKNADVWNVLGGLYARLGRMKDAAEAWRRTLALAPERPDVYNNLGTVLAAMGQTIGAIDAFQNAMRLAPGVPDYPVSLARAMLHEGRTEEAIQRLRRLAEQYPEYARVRTALASVLEHTGDFDGAAAECEQALRLDPNSAEAHAQLAQLCVRFGRLSDVVHHFEEAVRIDPTSWRSGSSVLMALQYDPKKSVQDIFEAHRAWGQRFADPATRRANPSHENDRDPQRKLRVGYLSPDFRNHPISIFAKPIFASHDVKHFEPVIFSDVLRHDDHTLMFRELVPDWHDIQDLSDDEVATLVRDQRIDVLIDLVGHTADNRAMVFARKPAPVQVSYLGYCNTTGMSAMDYVVGDDVTDPPERTQPYVEKLIRLPGSFSCFAPRADAPEPNRPPILDRGYATFGAFHKQLKLNDATLDLWARVLNEAPGSRLLMWRNTLTGLTRQRVIDEFARRGIDTERLDLRSERPATKTHLTIFHDVDVSLDSVPWSGHTTACESIWMGVPFVTIRGAAHAGRMAASALIHAGAGDMVADDADGFVKVATHLARDVARISEMRKTLRQRVAQSRLCDATKFTREWEAALRQAWATWCGAR
jgi:predicted O-linked N-acetylglucosamine transferase (SPINDLY family)